MIELKNIHVNFDIRGHRVQAVNDVSITVAAGEVYGIVGASGAGKSTLLRVINLLERPNSGHVTINGRDITHFRGTALRQERQKIGMIFQHFNLMHTRTVFDNAAYALRVAGKSQAEINQRVPEILRLVGLEDKANAYPSQLSGGQKQRVGIARAVANHPEVLLCDEPTSALDLETSAAILDLLKEINQRLGITIVLISHEMAVIKKICTKVAVMERGKVIEQGDVYDIFATPRQAFTKQLVEHTFSHNLPAHLTTDVTGGRVLKLFFVGDQAESGILSAAAIQYGVAIHLLHGKIEYIGHRAIGMLVVQIGKSSWTTEQKLPYETRVENAVNFISSHASRVEVLS